MLGGLPLSAAPLWRGLHLHAPSLLLLRLVDALLESTMVSRVGRSLTLLSMRSLVGVYCLYYPAAGGSRAGS